MQDAPSNMKAHPAGYQVMTVCPDNKKGKG
jgi:hypothetical protein